VKNTNWVSVYLKLQFSAPPPETRSCPLFRESSFVIKTTLIITKHNYILKTFKSRLSSEEWLFFEISRQTSERGRKDGILIDLQKEMNWNELVEDPVQCVRIKTLMSC
jgi:hypothetical protein